MAKKDTGRRRKRQERKRKKREEQKRDARARAAAARTPRGRLRRAARWPVFEARVNEDWRERGLATVVISRRGGDSLAVGFFLVDCSCLGVKDAHAIADFSEADYRRLLGNLSQEGPLQECDPALAVKIVETGLAYARRLGFRPHPDFELASEILGDIDASTCPEEIPCGRDGKPCYVAGPDDNTERILYQLRSQLGPGGFTFILDGAVLSEGFSEDDGEDDEELEPAVDLSGVDESVASTWRAIRRAEASLVPTIMREAAGIYGRDKLRQARLDFFLGEEPEGEPPEGAEFEAFFASWAVFDWLPEGEEPGEPPLGWPDGPLAFDFLERKGSSLTDFEQRLIREVLDRPYSFHVVSGVGDRHTLRVRDVFTREERDLFAPELSKGIRRGMFLFTRIITLDGVCVLSGCAPLIIPPIFYGSVLELRREIESEGRCDEERLYVESALLRELYLDFREDIVYPEPPELQNTDGEPLALTRLSFKLECSPREALEKLQGLTRAKNVGELLRGAKLDAHGEVLSARLDWQPPAVVEPSIGHDPVLGFITIETGKLAVEVNSAERAARIRSEIEKRLEGRVSHLSTAALDQEETVERIRSGAVGHEHEQGHEHEDELEHDHELGHEHEHGREHRHGDAAACACCGAPIEIPDSLREQIAQHWETWFDVAVPALGDRTPREAAQTEEGRELLEALLCHYELQEARHPGNALAAPIAELRRKLGLAP
ncbi:MAG: hypothetical protein AB1486_29475 [Planctomycetota bacterium]